MKLKTTITVLNKTKIINGIQTRIVEEKDFEDSVLVERSLNYFAISKKNNSVFYFGEDVDFFDKNGNIIGHEGSWRAGRNGAKPGLIMPGIALIGARYFQEIAPGVALDKAEILSVTDTVTVPVGTFKNVLKTEETTSLEPDVVDFKFYARGIGLIKDAEVSLVKFGFI